MQRNKDIGLFAKPSMFFAVIAIPPPFFRLYPIFFTRLICSNRKAHNHGPVDGQVVGTVADSTTHAAGGQATAPA